MVWCWNTISLACAVRWAIELLCFFSLSNNYYTILSSQFALILLGIVTQIFVFWRKNKTHDILMTFSWQDHDIWSQFTKDSSKLRWSFSEASVKLQRSFGEASLKIRQSQYRLRMFIRIEHSLDIQGHVHWFNRATDDAWLVSDSVMIFCECDNRDITALHGWFEKVVHVCIIVRKPLNMCQKMTFIISNNFEILTSIFLGYFSMNCFYLFIKVNEHVLFIKDTKKQSFYLSKSIKYVLKI